MLRRVVVRLPERILQLAGGVALVAFFAGALGIFYPLVVLPGIVLVWAATWRLVPPAPDESRLDWLAPALVVLGTVAWIIVQARFVSESIVAWRDPGIYALQGIWLAGHGSLAIPVDGAADLAAGITTATAGVGPWYDSGSESLLLQGGSGLSSVVALGAWAFGTHGALVATIVIGALVLVALYAAARTLVGAHWALAPVAVLAISMPLAVYSRAPYSETLVLALYLAALVWLASAFATGRLREFATAGVLLGATGFVRIDSSVALIGAALGFGAFVAFVATPDNRSRLVRAYLWFATSALGVTVLALGGLVLNSPLYLRELGKETLALLVLTVVVVSAAAFVAWLADKRGWPSRLGGSRRAALIVAIAVGALFVFWASRPLWLTSRLMFKPNYQSAVASYQQADGLPIDGTQSYEEHTLWWVAWYFGLSVLVLAAAGIVLLVHRSLVTRNAWMLVVVAVTLGTAVLYLDVVRITPDQIWAFRRIYPFILPGLLIGVAFALAQIARARPRVAIAVALVAVFQTGLAFSPMVTAIESEGQVAELNAACDAIDADTVVQLGSVTPSNYALTLRVLCDVQVVTIPDLAAVGDASALADLLAELYESSDGDLQFVTFETSVIDNLTGGELAPTHDSEIHTWERHILEIPNEVVTQARTMWVGDIGADGSISDR